MNLDFYYITRNFDLTDWLMVGLVACVLLAIVGRAIADLIYIFKNYRSW